MKNVNFNSIIIKLPKGLTSQLFKYSNNWYKNKWIKLFLIQLLLNSLRAFQVNYSSILILDMKINE